jgi:hypothetical protein
LSYEAEIFRQKTFNNALSDAKKKSHLTYFLQSYINFLTHNSGVTKILRRAASFPAIQQVSQGLAAHWT